ncbi:MAG TPA: cation-transporting P-type ATPase [Thermohalobaculum sp.]|nr:cation-transporting P-type ATPase [Thermohalobaculum sp.]
MGGLGIPDSTRTGVADAHARPAAEIAAALGVDPARGLDAAEAAARLKACGPNLLRQRRAVPALRILASQFASPVVGLLAAAALLSLAWGDRVEALAIAAVLVINAAIGFTTEIRAVRSMEALRRLGAVITRVRRGGRAAGVPAETLVPGDIVVLESGDVVTADLRLVAASSLAADESTLTGESVPVDKSAAAVPPETPVAERAPMLFKGTAVTRGSATGIVTGTGMATELGRISALVEQAAPGRSPLERQLDRLAGHLIWVTIVLCAVIAGVGIASGGAPYLMIEAAIALAVAAIPEGLPIVATMALARGMWRMARQNALVERLAAVETLGATTLIMTDKTGTLTENRLEVSAAVPASGEALRTDGDIAPDPGLVDALMVVVLCNNAELGSEGRPASGDPVEVALLRAGAGAGLDRAALEARLPRIDTVPFDSETAMMATMHRDGDAVLTCVKGAPEAVLHHCTEIGGLGGDEPLDAAAREAWLERTADLAEEGLRVLAAAWKRGGDGPAYSDLVFLGLIGLSDPAREDVPAAIAACRRAGIRVAMLTGDHAVTARKVATAIGLAGPDADVIEGRTLKPVAEMTETERGRVLATDIFARVTPAHKLDLVALHQAQGQIVAMTGDGVNDAPALRQADIGVAMGLRGTQVAREAAAMVLTDDAFATIVHAVREGRVIFRNIQRFVTYLLSCNLSEILVVGLAVLSGLPLPLLPLQILFLNLVTDVFPAFALGAGAGDDDVMVLRPRRPGTPILTRSLWRMIVGTGLSITASTLAAFVIAHQVLEIGYERALTVSFLTLAFAQLWNVFNMRDPRSPMILNDITRNPFVWAALALCTALLLAVTFIPFLAEVLRLERPGAAAWGLIAVFSLLPLAAGQISKAVSAGRQAP